MARTLVKILISISLLIISTAAYCEIPRNIYGAHLLVDNTGERGIANLKWARNLVGKYGWAKTLMYGINKKTQKAPAGWADWVAKCYEMDMIPICRLGGELKDSWQKPEKDADGSYKTIAQTVKRIVESLPRSDKYPLYIEVWNEPNCDLEWSGKANIPEYAQFFVEVSKAIRSIGDNRIKIMNGAFALSPESTEEACKAVPEFVNAFDVWASHPYPQNHTPEYNNHDGTAKVQEHSIDGYLMETKVLEKYGRKDVKVIITETGYSLGDDLFKDYPAIDEYNRADYTLRAFRDYWEKWPELIAVLPFEFSDVNWARFDWVEPESGTLADGTPTKPHYQYTIVSKLAKSTDNFGSISGKIKDSKFGVMLENVEITSDEAPFSVKTDVMGNYVWPKLKPGTYHLTIKKTGFTNAKAVAIVDTGKNAVADVKLDAKDPGSISGKILDAVTGTPIKGALVTLTPGGAKAISGADGKYTISGIPPLSYSALTTLSGYNSHEVLRLIVEPKGNVTRDFSVSKNTWPATPSDCSNPSFEILNNPNDVNLIGARWEIQGQGGGVYKVVDGVSHSGDRCQAIYASPAREVMLRMISGYGYSKPGGTYTAGVWVKTDGIFKEDNGGAWLSLDFQNNDGGNIESVVSKQKLGGSQGWTYLEVTGTAPQSQRISVVLHIKAKEGVAYFDDAYLGLVKPPKSK